VVAVLHAGAAGITRDILLTLNTYKPLLGLVVLAAAWARSVANMAMIEI
jgi:hypothetical protein